VVGATSIPEGWSACVHGGCLYFDGVDDHIEVPVDDDELDTGNYLTLAAWFRAWEPQVGKSLITVDRYSTNYKTRLYLVSENTASFTVRHPSGVLSTVTATFPFSLTNGRWRHLVGTYNRFAPDGQRLKLYLDGVEVASAAGVDAPIARGEQALYVGKFSGDYFRGLSDEVAVFNYALTDDQVADLTTSY